jgi:hypothetical protein
MMAKIIQMAKTPPLYEVTEIYDVKDSIELEIVKRLGNSWLDPKFKYKDQDASSHANADNFRKRQLKRMKEAGWK